MRRLFVLIGVGAAFIVPGGQAFAADAVPTFAKDVAPILYDKCVSCHRPGEVAPMSLLTYDQARPWAKAIKGKVLSREMPPWGADARYGTWANDRSLSKKQLDTITAWADNGAPKGNDANLPAQPTFATGWEHGQPDAVVEMLAPYHVPAEGQMPGNMNFYAPVPFKETKFGRLVEFRPGTRSVVHHCNGSVGTLPEGGKLDEVGQLILPDGSMENDITGEKKLRVNRDREAGVQRNSFEQLLDCVPGRSAFPVPSEEIGFKIPAGQYIRFGLHYQTTGRPETDQSKLGLWFTDRKEVQELHRQGVGHALTTSPDKKGFYFVESHPEVHDPATGVRWEADWPAIPAYSDNYTVMGVTPVTEAITLYGFTPHMHLRGTDMTWYVTYPDGKRDTLLAIPKYDFSWQLYYELQKPMSIPAGSAISNVAHYSNSAKNKFNPQPDKPVYWSEQSWDEMFLPFIAYTVDSQNLKKSAKNTSESPKGPGKQQR